MAISSPQTVSYTHLDVYKRQVNDVAMSISSAMNELVAVNPALTRRQLLRSGMNLSLIHI